MIDQSKERATSVGSSQDGEAPNFRTDTAEEIRRPELHADASSPAQAKRPKNREVENEMVKAPGQEGNPPRSATDPTGASSEGSGTEARRALVPESTNIPDPKTPKDAGDGKLNEGTGPTPLSG